MSYEGYVQCICKSGHYEEQPEPYGEELAPCCVCEADIAWANRVDQTNCDNYGEIPFRVIHEKFLVCSAITQTCNLGHKHVISEEVFRVPTQDETDPLRVYSAD